MGPQTPIFVNQTYFSKKKIKIAFKNKIYITLDSRLEVKIISTCEQFKDDNENLCNSSRGFRIKVNFTAVGTHESIPTAWGLTFPKKTRFLYQDKNFNLYLILRDTFVRISTNMRQAFLVHLKICIQKLILFLQNSWIRSL